MSTSPRIGLTRLITASMMLLAVVAAAVMPNTAHGTSEAKLTALSVGTGTLSPAFDADTLTYTVTGLSNSNDTLTVTATPATGYNVGMWVGSGKGGCGTGAWGRNRPLGEASTGTDEPLKVGRNVIEIYVAEDENPSSRSTGVRIYSLYVLRPGTMTISGSASVSHPENDTGVIGTYSVPAASGTITWDQDGDDSGGPGYTKFSISDTGELSFTYPLNYENPQDCDEDNVYEVTLWAYEGSDLVALLDVSVTVTDVDETQTGLPAITGTAQVGQNLTASTSAIGDTDGLENVSYSYQWLGDDTDISGATNSTYRLQSSDNNKVMKVRVTFSDDGGTEYTLTSEGTAQVNTPATGAPTISGTAQCGVVLTASTTAIDDANGLTNVSYSYHWLADDTDIDGETRSTYTVRTTDEGKVIKVQVSFTDDAGHQESLTSAGTSAVVMGGL